MSRLRMRALGGAAMIVILSVIAADAALADDEVSPPTVITINGLGGPASIEVQDGALFLPSSSPVEVSPQCFAVSGTVGQADDTLCIGDSGEKGELEVQGPWDPFIAGGWDAKNALRWIVNEAVTHLRLHHGLPLDYRIERLAASEIRAYLVQRVLGILDKSVHGVELTNNEQLTLTLVQQRVLEADKRISDLAYGEYQNWSALRCSYQPPPAPSFVTDPVLVPDNVRKYCNVLHSSLALSFEFAPPIPSVSDFLAWGYYQYAQDTGMSALGDPAAQELLQDMLAAGVVLGSFAAAAAAGAGAAALVGSSAALSAAVATAMGSTVAGSAAAAAYPASALSAMIGSTGASAAGWVVAIIVVGIVVTAVSIVQLVEHQSIGANLLSRKEKAERVTDPFNQVGQRARYGGTPIGTGWDERLPSHRSTAVTTRLRQLLLEWTTVDTGGVFHPDAEGVWSDNATDMLTDIHFEVKVDGGPFTPVASIDLPQLPGEAPVELRFDRSWPILTAPDGSMRAALTFPFVNADGKLVYASRLADNQFVLGEVESMRTGAGLIAPELSYLDEDGHVITARLIDPHADAAAGAAVRPAVVGMMLPDRSVRFRPNPLTATGAFYPPDQVDELSFEWTVDRFDSDTGAWIEVANVTGSSPSFVPDEVGSYSAEVVRTGDGQLFRGRVGFEIVPPDITVDVLRLDDDGGDGLKLIAAFSERVTSDELTVTVRWPGMLSTPEAELPSFDLVCGAHNGACATTGNPSGVEIAQQQLDLGAVNLNENVVVTVSNSWGVVAQRTLQLDSSARPRILAPPVPPAPPSDGDATAEFDDGVIFLQVPIETDGFQTVTLATIELPDGQGPGARFLDPDSVNFELSGMEYLSLIPADDGTVALVYTGIPGVSDLGLAEHLLTIVSGDSATTVVLRREVVPAVSGRYRAAAAYPATWDESAGTIPALTPIVLGGMADWSAYDGDICIELTNSTAAPPTTHLTCAPLAAFVNLQTAELTALSFVSLLPDGFRSGLWRVKAWLPVPDDGGGAGAAQVSAAPTHTTFRVESDAPVVTLDWTDASSTMTRTTTVQQGGPAVTGFTCTLDGSSVDCFDAGDDWLLDGLSDGVHEVQLVVMDASGNHSTATSRFRIGDAPMQDDAGNAAGQSTPRQAHLVTERGDGGAGIIEEQILPAEVPQGDSADSPDQPTGSEGNDESGIAEVPAAGGSPWLALPIGVLLLALMVGGGLVWFRRRAARH